MKIIALIKGAKVQDSFRPNIEPAGYGMVSTSNVSVFDNFPSKRKDLASIIITKFHEAKGVYRYRAFSIFSPIYWTEVVINLPKNVLIYLGIENLLITKVAQIIYWVVWIFYGVTKIILNPEILNKSLSIISSLFK